MTYAYEGLDTLRTAAGIPGAALVDLAVVAAMSGSHSRSVRPPFHAERTEARDLRVDVLPWPLVRVHAGQQRHVTWSFRPLGGRDNRRLT